MAFPEGLLANDEKVVKHLHPHWITLFVPVVVLLLVVAGAGFGIGLAPDGDSQQWVRIGVLAAAVVLLVPFVLVPILRWGSTHYVITSHRVMFRFGILNRHGKDIAYPRITDVAYSQSLWDRIVNAGNLTIESAGEGPPQVLSDVPHSDEVQQLINHLVEEDVTRRARQAGTFYNQAPARRDGEVDLGRESTSRYEPPR
ncbi:MAG: PH domain-containing protein [Geodermatophilaceae bacterium]|nr:PH domain-containing protein [Geodermatophilaceae bacterium]